MSFDHFFIPVKEISLVLHEMYPKNWSHPADTYCGRNLLIFVLNGSAECTINGIPYAYQKGDVVWLRTGDVYASHSAALPWEYISIYFSLYEEFDSSEFTDEWNPIFHPKDFNAMKILFQKVQKIYIKKNFGYLLHLNAELMTIFSLLVNEKRKEMEQKRTPPLLKPALDFIYTNYLKQNICVSELSRLCLISPRHFSRLFRNTYHTSPIDFVNDLKLQRAKNLLESTSLSVTEIASEAGFSEIFYFSKLFKKMEGLTPSEYRKSIAQRYSLKSKTLSLLPHSAEKNPDA